MFTSLDLSAILQAVVDIANLPALQGGLRDVDSNFNAVKYEPSGLTKLPRLYSLNWTLIIDNRSAGGPGGGGIVVANDYHDGFIQIGIAVAQITEARSTAQPRAEAFVDPWLNLLRSHMTLNGTVDFVKVNNIPMALDAFAPPAQQFFGIMTGIPFRKTVERTIGG